MRTDSDTSGTEEWWAALTDSLQAHVREESTLIESYERLLARVADPAVRLLVGLVVDDERRHHDLMQRMAAAARGEPSDGATTTPTADIDVEEAAALLDATLGFIAAEVEDRDRLRDLRRQLLPVEDSTLWPLLVELMEMDTNKHLRILQAVRRRLEGRTGSGRGGRPPR